MLPGDSTVLGTAGSGGDVFAAGLRGFFAAFPVLRLVLAVLVTFFRPTFLVALPFVFFLAINTSPSWRGLLDHIAHRRPLVGHRASPRPKCPSRMFCRAPPRYRPWDCSAKSV